jgi:hypothetical protein
VGSTVVRLGSWLEVRVRAVATNNNCSAVAFIG